jgi:hypothetical protein
MVEQTQEIAVASADTLASIVDEMFGAEGRTTFTLRSGKVVTFHQARFKHIAKITALFQEMLNRIPKDKFKEMIDMVVTAQVGAMKEGKSQAELDLNAANMIEKALGENSLLLSVFSTIMDILPNFVPQFCDLSADDFGELDLDEALVVASGVVAVNYSFFTQTLPPLLKRIFGGWKQKGATSSNTSDLPNSSTSTATA